MDATIRRLAGPVHAQLQQSLRPGAGVFLVWLIGGEHVGHVRLEQAAPIALLIAAGMDVLTRADEPIAPAPTGEV
jgi:predicted N-acetyltransferase YhbS